MPGTYCTILYAVPGTYLRLRGGCQLDYGLLLLNKVARLLHESTMVWLRDAGLLNTLLSSLTDGLIEGVRTLWFIDAGHRSVS